MHSSYSEVEKRRQEILKELEERDKVYVKKLAEKFGVTTETIRRDLDKLESLNKLKKYLAERSKRAIKSWNGYITIESRSIWRSKEN